LDLYLSIDWFMGSWLFSHFVPFETVSILPITSSFRFHPACIGMTIKEAKKLEHFFCQTCTAENGKMVENSHEATAQSEEKVSHT
jgi:hypothetical protein